MKKLVFFATSFSLVVAITSPLTGMNRWLCWPCCCGSETPKPVKPAQNAHRTEAVHRALVDAQKMLPAALRELYLKCYLPDYTFSPEIQDYLESIALIDHEGSISPQDQHILKTLLMPSETVLEISDWYAMQRVIDFTLRYPEQAAQLRAAAITPAGSPSSIVPAATLAILHDTYALLANKETITLHEKRRIIGLMRSASDVPENFTIPQPSVVVRPAQHLSVPYGDE